MLTEQKNAIINKLATKKKIVRSEKRFSLRNKIFHNDCISQINLTRITTMLLSLQVTRERRNYQINSLDELSN